MQEQHQLKTADMVVYEIIDTHGQVHPVRGQGFRGVNIYELIDRREVYRVWVEDYDPAVDDFVVVWQSRARRNPPDLADLKRLRDTAYPGGRVVEWHGTLDGYGVRTLHPSKTALLR